MLSVLFSTYNTIYIANRYDVRPALKRVKKCWRYLVKLVHYIVTLNNLLHFVHVSHIYVQIYRDTWIETKFHFTVSGPQMAGSVISLSHELHIRNSYGKYIIYNKFISLKLSEIINNMNYVCLFHNVHGVLIKTFYVWSCHMRSWFIVFWDSAIISMHAQEYKL